MFSRKDSTALDAKLAGSAILLQRTKYELFAFSAVDELLKSWRKTCGALPQILPRGPVQIFGR